MRRHRPPITTPDIKKGCFDPRCKECDAFSTPEGKKALPLNLSMKIDHVLRSARYSLSRFLW